MFLQVIQGRVTNPQEVRAALDRWVDDLSPGATGWLGSTVGVTEESLLIATVRFTSQRTARANSSRPEQDEWWTETARLFTGEVTFHDCREAVVLGAGGSDDAQFVQVIQGRSDNIKRLRELARAFEPMMATHRPELLGSTIGLHGDGEFTQVAYFTNEEEARQGESRVPPPEVAALLEEQRSLSQDLTYYDLRDPWLYAPSSKRATAQVARQRLGRPMTITEGGGPMTTDAETQGTEAPEREGIEHPLLLAALLRRRRERGDSLVEHPLLLAALMRRRGEDDDEGIEHPLLLAALMRRRGEDDDEGIEHPLLLAALMRRRRERGDSLVEHPLLLAALMRRRGEDDDEGIEHPLLLAALMRRRRERGDSLVEHPLLLAALMRRRREDDDEGIEHPLLLAALMRRRREDDDEGIEHPLLLAALMRRRGEDDDEGIEHPLLLAALMRRRR